MIIEFTLVSIDEDGVVITLEAEDWVVAIVSTLADPNATIDTNTLDNPEE